MTNRERINIFRREFELNDMKLLADLLNEAQIKDGAEFEQREMTDFLKAHPQKSKD